MQGERDFIATQQLWNINKTMGQDLYLAFDLIATRLDRDRAPISQDTVRENAEFREARKIIQCLKNPDSEIVLSRSEVAWAFHKLIKTCSAQSLQTVVVIMRHAASMLGIDVAKPQVIPSRLDMQIGNEVKVLAHQTAPAVAVAG